MKKHGIGSRILTGLLALALLCLVFVTSRKKVF